MAELIQLMETIALPEIVLVLDVKFLGPDIQGYRVGSIGLQLQCMGTGVCCGIDDLQCAFERLVMIARHFGDDERRRTQTDAATADGYFQFHCAAPVHHYGSNLRGGRRPDLRIAAASSPSFNRRSSTLA